MLSISPARAKPGRNRCSRGLRPRKIRKITQINNPFRVANFVNIRRSERLISLNICSNVLNVLALILGINLCDRVEKQIQRRRVGLLG